MSTNLPKNYNGVVELIIRPTGLLDPIVDVRPSLPEGFRRLKEDIEKYEYLDTTVAKVDSWEESQIPNMLREIERVNNKGQRVLITTLTKRMAEELSDYLLDKKIASKYLHSDIDTVERVEILRDLRKGIYTVLVGINLLREGLDLPEVGLIIILDADKEGFLRSATSLIQTIGRAARNQDGYVIMYADKITDSMKKAIDETRRRRTIQTLHNTKHGITPKSIQKEIKDQLERAKKTAEQEDIEFEQSLQKKVSEYTIMSKKEQKKFVNELKFQMQLYADSMDFEKAAEVRDVLKELESSKV